MKITVRSINLLLKYLFDFVFSLVGLAITAPLLIVISVLIKSTSPGPVFFKQLRLGKDGRVFNIIKFRTMVINAEQMGDELLVRSENDSRITRLGKILRSTSMDELPQLFNVLKQEMSIVGPRPPATYHPYDGYCNYPEWARKRFTMRPGVTGLAQVKVRNSVSWTERMMLDNQYIDDFSIWLDCKILVATIIKLFKPENIYS